MLFTRPRALSPVVISLLVGLVGLLPAGPARAQNLATNPGFETGNTSGWFTFGSPTISATTAQAHSGTYSALVTNRTATYMGIAQSFQGVLTAGQTYNISAWVRLVSGANQTVNLTMQKVDGGGTAYATVASGSVSTNNWSQLSGSYALNVSGTLTSLVFYAEVTTSSNAAYYFDDVNVEAPAPVSTTNGQCTVSWTNVFQRIDGFGASSAWRSSWTAAQADMFFSTNSGTGTAKNGTQYAYTGVGLSLLRSRIVPGGTTWEQSIMQMAQARGARVWSAPWSPAVQFKSNNNVNGGSFVGNAANYQAYANQLAGYVVNMKNQYGVNLYALSVQNEPDADVTTYESCNWTAQQIHDFIPYLSGALIASNVGSTKIMLPESQNWTDPQGLRLTTMNDPATASLVGIIANHNYVADNANGDQSTPAAINSYGKALWETEVAKLSGNDSNIGDGLYWAGRAHLFLTAAQVNAFHYWWLCAHQTSNEGLCDTNDVPAKRMYALGNFSRFVRPNFYRIGVVSNTGPLQISAYKEPTNGAVAIVVINPGTNVVTQTFNLSGFGVTNLTPWLTSASTSLASQPPVTVNGSIFTNTIPALSIVTFVGRAANTNSAPTNITLANATLGENQPPVSTVGALITTDPDSGNTFTYTLVSGAGSTDNGSFSVSGSNLLTAASFNYEAQNFFNIRIRSTDQGGLFFEKAFTITVTNANEAPTDMALSNVTVGENQPSGTAVGALTTTDPDAGNTFTYTLVSGTGSAGNGSFSISGGSLLTDASFNYEVQNSYSIRVRSTDQGGLFFEKASVVTVANVNEAPALAIISDVTIGVGVNLSLTNVATDPELPAQALQFTLLGGPENASLDLSSGVFTWRPLVSQQATTNPVTVRVADNGAPSLSATNTFSIAVPPLAEPTLMSISLVGPQVSLEINGPVGPDYSLWATTNLADWQWLQTITPAVLPVTVLVTNTEPQSFYRLELGP